MIEQKSPEWLSSDGPRSHRTCLVYMNRWVPVGLHAACLLLGGYGIFIVMPTLYDNYVTLRLCQLLVSFGILQVMGHWYLTRSTDTSYNPDIHLQGLASSNTYHDVTSVSESRSAITNGDGDLTVVQNTNQKDLKFRIHSSEDATLQEPLHYYNNNDTSRSSWGPDQTVAGCRSQHGISKNRLDGSAVVDLNILGLPDESEQKKSKMPQKHRSWSRCQICKQKRPPRCHHCPLCQRCIQKRDHHCFFVGVCIGAQNQQQFMAFLLWCSFVTLFACVHMYPYTQVEILPFVSYFDFFLPVALFRFVLGYIEFRFSVLCVMFWFVNGFTVASTLYACRTIALLVREVTYFESNQDTKWTGARSVRERLRLILGDNWLLSFVIPFRRKTFCSMRTTSKQFLKTKYIV